MKKFALAFALLITMPAVAQTPAQAPAQKAPTPVQLDLARRVLASTEGDIGQTMQQSMLAMAKLPPFSTAQPIYLASVKKTLAAHRADIARMQEEKVRIYAGTYTEADMRTILAHTESPIGKSIREKQLAKTLQMVGDGKLPIAIPTDLTPAEQTAQKNFVNGPWKAMQPRAMKAMVAAIPVTSPLMSKVTNEAMLGFCNSGGTCSTEMLAKLNASGKARQ